jgi:hypothetical protein
MPLTVSKHYEENIKIGDFLFAKVGLTIASDKLLTTPEEVENASKTLGKMAKDLVHKELIKIKEEKEREI